VHPAIAPLLLKLRFSTVRYESGLGDGNIYETVLKTPNDTAIVRWLPNETASSVFLTLRRGVEVEPLQAVCWV
jgi:hypothetical protein